LGSDHEDEEEDEEDCEDDHVEVSQDIEEDKEVEDENKLVGGDVSFIMYSDQNEIGIYFVLKLVNLYTDFGFGPRG
jgi:hypothetical protein